MVDDLRSVGVLEEMVRVGNQIERGVIDETRKPAYTPAHRVCHGKRGLDAFSFPAVLAQQRFVNVAALHLRIASWIVAPG